MGFALAEGPDVEDRMALLRRSEYARRSSGAQRTGHVLFARRPLPSHAHFNRADPHDGNRAAPIRVIARRRLSARRSGRHPQRAVPSNRRTLCR